MLIDATATEKKLEVDKLILNKNNFIPEEVAIASAGKFASAMHNLSPWPIRASYM